jgi:hypothetical protein
LVAVTVAPGTIAPDSSLIVPVKRLRSNCAAAGAAIIQIAKTHPITRADRANIPEPIRILLRANKNAARPDDTAILRVNQENAA